MRSLSLTHRLLQPIHLIPNKTLTDKLNQESQGKQVTVITQANICLSHNQFVYHRTSTSRQKCGKSKVGTFD
ncbi:hypothetical protein Hanom_Chr02g00101361 [Helianthus anomalus]